MVYHYYDLNDDKMTTYSSKGIKFHLFAPDDFYKYSERMKKHGKRVSVVGITSLKTKTKHSQLHHSMLVNEKKFILKEKRECIHKLGYIPVSDTQFVILEGGMPFLCIPMFLILMLAMICFFSISKTSSYQDDNETTEIPCFTTIHANSTDCNVKLYNQPENTVDFVYTILEKASEDTIQTFDDLDDAQAFISDSSHSYMNYYDAETDAYLVTDINTGEITDEYTEYIAEEQNGVYAVVRYAYEVVYFTTAIAPGESVEWDIYDAIDSGTHELVFKISTYDIDTHEACYGTTQDVEVIIDNGVS